MGAARIRQIQCVVLRNLSVFQNQHTVRQQQRLIDVVRDQITGGTRATRRRSNRCMRMRVSVQGTKWLISQQYVRSRKRTRTSAGRCFCPLTTWRPCLRLLSPRAHVIQKSVRRRQRLTRAVSPSVRLSMTDSQGNNLESETALRRCPTGPLRHFVAWASRPARYPEQGGFSAARLPSSATNWPEGMSRSIASARSCPESHG